MRPTLIIAALIIFFSSTVYPSRAQSYRESNAVPVGEVLEKLLGFSKRNEFEKIDKSLVQIKSLSETLDSKYSRKIEKSIQIAVQEKDGERALKAIQALIFYDMKDLLSIGIDSVQFSKEKAIVKFKYAYLDYLLLSPFIQVQSYSGDQKIRNLFRKFALSINNSENLKSLNEEIEREIINSDPDLNEGKI